MEMHDEFIERYFDNQELLEDLNIRRLMCGLLMEVLVAVEKGERRAATKRPDGSWVVDQTVKKAILLYFVLQDTFPIHMGGYCAADKMPLQFTEKAPRDFRLVPGTILRRYCHVSPGVILMPSFINVGSYIGPGTMIDSGVTVGSCAQIGEKCHISSNVVIGGVLEPIGMQPVIVEDNVFIGAGSNVTEGVYVGEGSVLSMNVQLSSSMKIYDRASKKISYGIIPPYSVVVPGVINSAEDDGIATAAAIIVKTVDAQTRAKTSINNLLRG